MNDPHTVRLPAGLVARPPKPDDLDTVVSIIAACELEELGSVEISAEDVASDWRRPGVDLGRDGVLVVDGATASPVAYAEVFAGRGEGHVLASCRGRGIGSYLAVWLERRAHEQGSAFVRQIVPAGAVHRLELLSEAGYEQTDTAWSLELAAAELPPDAPPLPPGLRVRDFQPGIDDHAAWDLIERSFSHWPNREPTTLASWRALTVDRDGFEPWLFPLVVDDGGEVVGGAYCIDNPDDNTGWVQQLAVREDLRSRGIGRAVLHRAFARFALRGRERFGLSTDTRTGALDLYLALGMHIVHEFSGMRLALR